MGAMMMRAAKAIGLTDEQMNRLRGMRVAHQREMIRLRADAQIARLDLEEALRQPNAKFADVKAKVAAISALHGQMMEKKVAFRLDARQVLTPEQQQKLRELMMGRAMGAWGPGAGAMGRGGWGGGWGQGQKGPQPELKK
jgi:Spy/CpxP family protein refolding chaperone